MQYKVGKKRKLTTFAPRLKGEFIESNAGKGQAKGKEKIS